MELVRMKINITSEAANWFKEEYEITEYTSIRFFVRYGGVDGNIPGFSLGVALETPDNMHTSVTVKNIQFFVDEADVWYFQDKNLFISLDEQLGEPKFAYER